MKHKSRQVVVHKNERWTIIIIMDRRIIIRYNLEKIPLQIIKWFVANHQQQTTKTIIMLSWPIDFIFEKRGLRSLPIRSPPYLCVLILISWNVQFPISLIFQVKTKQFRWDGHCFFLKKNVFFNYILWSIVWPTLFIICTKICTTIFWT